MIIEGSHKATGNGIFVSDIQEKSAAFHVSCIKMLKVVVEPETPQKETYWFGLA